MIPIKDNVQIFVNTFLQEYKTRLPLNCVGRINFIRIGIYCINVVKKKF